MKCLVAEIIRRDAGNEYLLILPEGSTDAVQETAANVTRLASRLKYYSIPEQIELPRLLRREKVDLLHSPHFNLPLLKPCPTVVTIHDVIYLACPEDLPSRLGRLYYRQMMRASVRLADRIITDSVFSKQDIVRWLDADPDKIDVIYPGVDSGFHAGPQDETSAQDLFTRLGIRSSYVLYTGIYKPRKNHAGLLRAFRCLLDRGLDMQLVVAGPLAEGQNVLTDLAQQLGISNNLVLAGFVRDADLRALYSHAHVYACPSIYEGFGFTVLEAMACDVPVVCSPETSLPEVAGNAALFADPRSPQEFAEALYRASTDAELRQQLSELGRKNVSRFEWRTTAELTFETYRRVLESSPQSMVSA